MFSSRNPDTLKDLVAKAGAKARLGRPDEAAKWGDVIVVAVPYGALPQVGNNYAALMKGQVVIELGNPRADRDLRPGDQRVADAEARPTPSSDEKRPPRFIPRVFPHRVRVVANQQ